MPTIIIPTNDERCWRECVAAVRKNEPWIDYWGFAAAPNGFEFGSSAPSAFHLVRGPFCFSKSVNHVIKARAPRTDNGVLILNHDALLETPGGFSSLIAWTDAHPEYGVMSAAVRGACCNPIQTAFDPNTGGGHDVQRFGPVVDTDVTVAFVAVYIPRRTLDTVGLLCEELTGYGFDDDLYCDQVRAAGLRVGVYHGCVVEHGSLPSSYRTRPDCRELMDYNHRQYHRIVRERGLTEHSTHMRWCQENF